MIQRKVV